MGTIYSHIKTWHKESEVESDLLTRSYGYNDRSLTNLTNEEIENAVKRQKCGKGGGLMACSQSISNMVVTRFSSGCSISQIVSSLLKTFFPVRKWDCHPGLQG